MSQGNNQPDQDSHQVPAECMFKAFMQAEIRKIKIHMEPQAATIC
jgi:hypothetical protein